jgi:flavin-dependent dehydrogenase
VVVLRREIVIVGSGPAGAATALGIAARDPRLAGGTTILERTVHPRDKTCAGGVIPKGVRLLRRLGLELDVPQVRVDHARVDTPHARVAVDEDDLCRVVRRRELDAMLAWAARERGVELRENEHVRGLARDGDGIRVTTDRATYWARAVVGADGSGSQVRRALVPGDGGILARALMTDVSVRDTPWNGCEQRRYDFDFRSCATGLRGYRWAFPCLIDGRGHANVGVYALPPVDGGRLRHELDAFLVQLGTSAGSWKAFPIRTLTARSVVCAPRTLLVGDAAGVDPLMGEGISFALEYAELAAQALVEATATGEWSFAGYGRAVHRGPLGRKLRRLGLGARLFYGRASALAFRAAAVSARAQAIGLRWYNGVDGWDERSAASALWTIVTRQSPKQAA